jgi:curli biogenesis system outer membrane secretion channel CsgG
MRKVLILTALFILFSLQESFALNALKKTIAVFDFENDSGIDGWYNIGQDFGTQLSDALLRTEKFIVLSRQDLAPVLAEQDLANSDRFAKSDTAKIGKILPAQLLIKGKITEFEYKTSDSKNGVRLYGLSIKANQARAHIAVVLQVINSSTGEIVDSKRIEGEAVSTGTSVDYSGSINLNSANFNKTPMGKAVQMAIDRAADYVAEKTSNLLWSGKVMLVKDNVIYINSGANAGIKQGDILEILNPGEALIDPDTGMQLGTENKRLGQLKISEVEEKFAKGAATGNFEGSPKKGDIVLETK